MENKETIFTTISRLAQQHNALNLGQGFPNFDPDPRMTEIIKEIAGQKVHQYAPMKGNPRLIQRIIEMTSHFYQREIQPENVLVTAGATQAIFTTISALIEANDEVIIFDPAYDCYDTPVLQKKGIPVHLNLTFPDYKIDWEMVNQKVTSKTKMIIINNPHNPSGAVFGENDIVELEKIVENHPQILILADEVYEYISFDLHYSVNRSEILRNRSIVISSFGKTLHLTGWKVGYLLANEKLMNKIIQIHQYNVFSVNSLSQEAIWRYINLKDIEDLNQFFEDKKKLFLNRLENSKFKVIPTGGTYFQLLDYSEICNDKDEDMALKMIKEHGLASIPVSGFYKDKSDYKVLRFCYGKDDDSLIKAGKILCQI